MSDAFTDVAKMKKIKENFNGRKIQLSKRVDLSFQRSEKQGSFRFRIKAIKAYNDAILPEVSSKR